MKFSFPYGPFSGRSAWAASKISQNKPFFWHRHLGQPNAGVSASLQVRSYKQLS